MIFVTVGTQLPFDRLLEEVDKWASHLNPRPNILGQVGSGRTDFMHITCVRALNGPQYAEAIQSAELIISHAGTGSILTALDRGIPVVVMPRDHRRGEHRDDHQYQTARQLEQMGLINVAWRETDLPVLIERALAAPPELPGKESKRGAELIDYLRSYLLSVVRR